MDLTKKNIIIGTAQFGEKYSISSPKERLAIFEESLQK